MGTWTAAANVSEADLGDELKLSAVYTPESGKFPNGDVEVQWYSWREGDKDWQPEGEKVRYKGDGQSHTATLSHTVTSADYGRQWKLGVKASSPDESVTGSSNVVTVSITPPAPTDVACGCEPSGFVEAGCGRRGVPDQVREAGCRRQSGERNHVLSGCEQPDAG